MPITGHGLCSRRVFLRTAGATFAGTALGARPWRSRSVLAGQTAASPLPIPGGNPADPASGLVFHAMGPGPGNPNDEPSTITNLDGFVGLAYISGTCTRTNVTTGETRQLPFVSNDMRFMKGSYQGADGQMRTGAFAFI
jgi:hypothetical protein